MKREQDQRVTQELVHTLFWYDASSDSPANWREVSIRRVIVAILTGEHTVTELAAMRGGEPHVLMEHVERELKQMGMPALSLTVHHQAAAAEIILARDSHFRSKHAGP